MQRIRNGLMAALVAAVTLVGTTPAWAQHHGGGGHMGGGHMGGGHMGGGHIGGGGVHMGGGVYHHPGGGGVYHHPGGYNHGGYYNRGGFYSGLGLGYGLGSFYGGYGLGYGRGYYGYGRGYGYGYSGYPYYGYSSYGYSPYYSYGGTLGYGGYGSYGGYGYPYGSTNYYNNTYVANTPLTNQYTTGYNPNSVAQLPPLEPTTLYVPKALDGTLSYQVNQYNYTIATGQAQTLNNDRDWEIQFNRGDGTTARYSLPPGNYRFTQTAGRWDLVRSSMAPGA